MYDKMLFIRMLIKSLNSGNHYQFITLFVVCATGRSCLLLTNNVVPFDNKDSAKKKHRQIYRFIKVLWDRTEVLAGQGEYILQSNVFCNPSPLYCFVKLRNMAGERSMLDFFSVTACIFRYIHWINPSVTSCHLPYILLCKTQRRRFNTLLSHYLSNETDRVCPSPSPCPVALRGVV